ncbi:MAG: GAF domain-containing protein [Ardenticatenaceae bacterium]|nr:GAF domain-containing protein [Ardenticatenaceae bacterium]
MNSEVTSVDGKQVMITMSEHQRLQAIAQEKHMRDTEKLQYLEKLSLFSRQMMSSLGQLSLDEQLRFVAQYATEILQAESAGVLLVKQPGILSLEASYGHHPGKFEKGRELIIQSEPKSGLTGHIAYTGEIFRAHGTALTGHFAVKGEAPPAASGHCYSLLAVPLQRHENGRTELLGLLRIDNKKDENGRSGPDMGFSQEDEWIAGLFADAVQLAIQNAALWDETDSQREQFHRLVAGSPDAVITNDREGRIQVYNRQAEIITGYTEAEMKGKSVQAVYAESHEARRVSRLLHQFNGKLTDYETVILGKDGHRIPIRLTAHWIFDSRGLLMGTVGYFEDLRVSLEQEGRLDLLAKASVLLSQAQNLTAGLQQLAEMMATFWRASFCRIFLLDEEQQFLTMRAVYPLPEAARGFSWRPEVGSVTAVADWPGLAKSLNKWDSFLLRNTHPKAPIVLQKWTELLQLDQDIQSLLVIPLRTRDKVVGLLDLGILGQESPSFAEREDLAITLAAQTAVLIDRISLHESTERRGRLLEALDETLRHIHAAKETPKLLQETVRLAANLTGCTCGGFYINSPHTAQLTLTAHYNLPDYLLGTQLNHHEGLIGEVAHSGQSRYTNTFDQWPNSEAIFASLGFQTVMAVPLRKAGIVEAVLFVADLTNEHAVLTVDLEILERFAVQAAIVMQTSLLVDREQRLFTRWKILHRMSDYIQANRDLKKTLHVFLTCITAGYGLGYNRAALFLIDDEREMLIGRLGIGHVEEKSARLDWDRDHQQGVYDFGHYLTLLETKSLSRTPLSERIPFVELSLKTADTFNQVLQNQKPIIITEDRLHQLPSLFATLFEPTTPIIIAPLIVHNRAIGLLVVDNKFTQAPVTKDDLELLLTFCNTAASAIEKTQLLEATEAARIRLHSFYKASNDLVNAKDPEQIWRNIVEQISTVAHASHAKMRLINPRIGRAQDLITTGIDEPLFQGQIRPDGLSIQVMRTGTYVKIEDARQERERVNPTFFERGILAAVGLPVAVEGQLIGVLWVYYNHTRRFSTAEIETYQFYVNQAAIAYDNARRIKELDTLQQAIRLLTSANSLQEVCQYALHHACQLFNAISANIWLYDQQHHKFIMGDAVGFPPDIWQHFKENLPRSDGFAMKIMKNGWSGIQDVAEHLADINPTVWNDLRRMNIRSFQGIALTANQKNLGVLYLNYDYPRHYPPQEQKSLQTLAQHISLAISKTLLLESMEKVKNTTGIIAQMATLSKLDDTLAAVAQGLFDALGCDVVTLHVYDPDKDAWIYPPKMAGVHYQDKISTPEGQSMASLILHHVHQLKVVDDVRYDPIFQSSRFTRDEDIRSSVIVPLQVGEERVGVVLISYRSPHRFAEEELDYIHLFTNQAAVAIHNAHLFERQQRQATALLALDKVAHAVTHPDRLGDDVLTAIAEQAWKLTRRFDKEARFSNVVLLQGRALEFRATYPLEHLLDLRQKVGLIDLDKAERIGIMGRVVETAEPLLVPNVTLHPDYLEYDAETCSELAVPIKSGSQVIGAINVEHPVEKAFDKHDLQALLALAEYAAIAIENAKLFQSQQKQKLMLEALYAAGRAMTSSLNLDEILREIIVQVRRHTENQGRPASYTSIWLVEENLTAKAFITHPPEVLEEIKTVIGEQLDWQQRGNERIGIIGRAILTKESALVADVSQNPDYVRIYPTTQSELAVPIILADTVIGVLNLEHTELNAFDNSDLHILEALARQAAIAIQNARLFAQSRQRAEELTILNEMGRNLTVSHDVGDVVTNIYEYTNRLMDAQNFYVALDDKENRVVTFPLAREAGQEITLATRPFGKGATEYVIQTGQPLLIEDGVAEWLDAHNLDAANAKARSWLGVPLRIGDEVLGAVAIRNARSFAYNANDQNLLTSISSQSAIAIQNARLYEKAVSHTNLLTAAAQVASRAISILVEGELLVEVVNLITESLGFYHTAVFLLDNNQEHAILKASSSQGGQKLLASEYQMNIGQEGIVGYVARTGHYYFAPNVQQDAYHKPNQYLPDTRSEVAFPLVARGQVIGILDVQSRQEVSLSSEEIATLQTMANHLAHAIQNVRLYNQVQRQAITSKALYDASQAITSSLDIAHTLNMIAQQAAKLTGTIGPEATLAYLAKVHDERLIFSAVYPREPATGLKETIEGIDLSQDSCGITGRAVKTGQPQLVRNVLLDKDYIACDANIRSVLAVPIKSGTVVKGVIVVESPGLAAFDEQDEQALVSLAGQASLAIQNAEEHDETVVLQHLATGLVGVLELTEVLSLALEAAMTVTGTESSAVIFWDEETEQFGPAYRMDAGEKLLHLYQSSARPTNGMTREFIRRKDVVVIPDTSEFPNINPTTLDRGRRAQIVVPLWSETAVIGALYIHSLKKRTFSQHQLTVLETLASQTAVAINKARQYKELKQTKGLVGSRTALAWMGMASNAWRHSIEGDAVNIRNLIPLLRGEIHNYIPNVYLFNNIEDKLNRIEKLAGQILARPITPPLSSEEGVEEVIIHDLIQERVQQLWKDEHYRNVPFPHLELQEAAHSKVWISSEWLRLAFDLLVDNAVEAMREAPIRQLTITITDEDDQIMLAIQDSGKGIPPELRDRLFQVTLPEARRYGHLGRGLLMVQAIVETYGGDVKVGGTGPQGTTMIVTLPKHA